MWEEINTVEQFQKLRESNDGYIVITDNANPNRIHEPNCENLKTDYFIQKVLISQKKNGRYFWVANKAIAEEKWNTDKCLHCWRG